MRGAAIRSFARTPVFTGVILLTLAAGIGANTAIFTVVKAVLLAPLPYPDPSALMRVRGGTSMPDLRDWIQHTSSFAAIGGFRPQAFDFSPAGIAERIDGAIVTAGLLDMLGARPALGRLIADEDSRAGADRVVVVSAGFWRSHLAGDPAAVGRTIDFNGVPYRVAGVLAPGFELPGIKAHLFSPIVAGSREARFRGAHTLRAIVRLRQGIAAPTAQHEMDALSARLAQQYPESNHDVRFVLVPLKSAVTGAVRRPLLLLFVTVGLVLLIACVNVANLLSARGAARCGELAVRAALGATPARIVWLLLKENLLLAAAGGALGLPLSWWIVRTVVALAPADTPRLDNVSLDLAAFGYTALICAATGLLFGLLPAVSALRVSQMPASTRVTAGGRRLRGALAIAEIAIALVLVSGAGLLLRSFHKLTTQPVGFTAAGLVTANITFSAPRYGDVATRTRLYDALEEQARSLPGVRAVALTTDLPVGGSPIFHNLAFDGRVMGPGTEPEVYYRGINAGYFDAFGIPVRAGRRFTAGDRADAPRVAIVNEAFAREYYPNDRALGRRIRWVSGNGEWITIVGVVADVRGLSLDRGEVPAVYVPYAQEHNPWRTYIDIAVRSDGEATQVATMLRQLMARLDPAVPLTQIATMDQVLAASLASRRFNLALLTGFAVVSLLLVAAGTYGVMSQVVAQRTRELGVRLALGATPGDVFNFVVGHGMSLTAAGVLIGLVASAGLSRVLAGMLFETSGRDLPTFTAAALVLLAAAAAATVFPARRAARVDPLIVLRSE
jgi:putative ABC transport system permease protein